MTYVSAGSRTARGWSPWRPSEIQHAAIGGDSCPVLHHGSIESERDGRILLLDEGRIGEKLPTELSVEAVEIGRAKQQREGDLPLIDEVVAHGGERRTSVALPPVRRRGHCAPDPADQHRTAIYQRTSDQCADVANQAFLIPDHGTNGLWRPLDRCRPPIGRRPGRKYGVRQLVYPPSCCGAEEIVRREVDAHAGVYRSCRLQSLAM